MSSLVAVSRGAVSLGALAIGVVGSVWLASCAAGLNEAPLVDDDADAPVVAILHTRDRELTITGGTKGMRYSLVDADGELEEDLTLEQLAERDPDLFELVKSAMARSNVTPKLDARIIPEGSKGGLSADRNRLESAIYRDGALLPRGPRAEP
jgi:hypothetical protein